MNQLPRHIISHKGFQMTVRPLVLCLLLLFSTVLPCKAETIYLSVAASMTDAMKEIVATFSTTHPEGKILSNFASSGSLAKQINQGAPAHLYISANPKWMKYLVKNNMIDTNTKQVFAYNTLVFIARPTVQLGDLDGLKKLSHIAIGSPGSVPAGQYAKQAMEAAHIYTDLEQNNKLVMAKDVRQALIYADRGEVDGAFVYKTDALLAKDAFIAFAVPMDLYNRVEYPLALTKLGAGSELALQLYNFITGESAAVILEKYGFKPVR